MKRDKLYEAFSYIDDWYLDIVDTPTKEANEMKHYTLRRVITVAIAAAVCISLLGVTAMAAGWIPNIFASVKPSTPEEQEILDAAVQVTQPQEPEIVSVPEVDFTQFTLFERYYDGESILLGFDLNKTMPETIVGYQPDEKLLAEIKSIPRYAQTPIPGQTDDTLEQRVELGSMTQEEYETMLNDRSDYAKQYDLRKYHQINMDWELKRDLTAEQYETFWEILVQTGSCCVAIPNEPWVGDRILVNGTNFSEFVGPGKPGNFRSDYTTEEGDCILLNPIPEVTRNLPSVEVELSLKSGWRYWYMELDGDVYEQYVQNPPYQATFTLENVNK